MNEFWDRPRLGVADVGGSPHIYRCPFDSSQDDFADYYLVAPINPDLLPLILEDWEIWMRWSAAHDEGRVSIETHPCLPEDQMRSEQLRLLIADRLEVDPNVAVKLSAEFRSSHIGWDGLQVCWTAVERTG